MKPIRAIVILCLFGLLMPLPASAIAGEASVNPELEAAISLYRSEGAEAALPEFEGLGIMYRRNGKTVDAVVVERYLGECHWRLGNYDLSRTHLDRALSESRQLDERLLEGKILNVLGLLEWDLGNYDRAIEQFREASSIGAELGNRRLAGSTMNNLSLVYDERGDYPTSLKQYEEALRLYEGTNFRRGVSDTLGNIGGVYLLLGRYREALSYYRRALEISVEMQSKPSMSLDHGNLALCYLGLGELDRALEHSNRALALARETGMRKEEALWLRGRGNIRIRHGQYDLGLEDHRTALAIYEEIKARGTLLDALHDMGRIHLLLGDLVSARQFFERGTEEAHELGIAQAVTANLIALGDIQFRQEHTAEAEVLYREARQRAADAGEQGIQARALLRLALAHRQLGRLDEADGETYEALTIARQTGATGTEAEAWFAIGELERLRGVVNLAMEAYAKSLSMIKDGNHPELLWQVHYGKARAEIAQGEHEQALADLEASIRVIESVRERLREERFRAGYVQDKYEVYVALVRLQMELGLTKQAFSSAERLRARSFLDQFEQAGMAVNSGVERHTEFALRERIRQLQGALDEETDLPPPDRRQLAINTFSSELLKAEREYQAFLDDRFSRSVIGQAARVTDAADIQALLHQGQALLEYVVDGDRVMMFVLKPGELRAVSSELDAGNLFAKVNLVRELIQDPSNNLWLIPAASLAESLIAPLQQEALLEGVNHLYVVPHGVLNYLPFALLPDETGGEENLIIERYSLSYLPAAASLAHARPVNSTGRQLLALAPKRSSLQYSEREARSIAAMFQPDARLLLGASATESAFKDEAGKYGILHLSTHGYFNSRNPLLSGLELEADQHNDGYLEVHEIISLSLNARLVTLSACETGMGSGYFNQIPAGDDFVGLTRAFLLAGSRSVLATLWEVDDRSTLELMEGFYARLGAISGGAGHSIALAEIQRELRLSKNYRHPFYWAPFILVGQQHPVEGTQLLARRGLSHD
jgi:CHAT domain-containing protein